MLYIPTPYLYQFDIAVCAVCENNAFESINTSFASEMASNYVERHQLVISQHVTLTMHKNIAHA